MDKKRVVIIGAGPAGLSAAYELSKHEEFEVIVLEAENFVGGISRTVLYKGNRMDIGGHRFFTKNDRVNALWNELMPIQGAPSWDDRILGNEKEWNVGGPDPEKKDNVMLLRHRVSRIYFLKKFFDYPISLKPQTFINMGFLRTMKCGFGYIGSSIHKRDEKSLEDFYINRFGKPLYELFFKDYTTKLWGVSPKNLSPDWGAQRVKGLSLWKALGEALAKPFKKDKNNVETTLIDQFQYPKFGPGQFYSKMAETLRERGVKFLYNAKVSKVILDENRNIYGLQTEDGQMIDGDYFLSSMPVKDLFEAFGRENVSKDAFEVATSLPYRDFITVGILLDGLAIKNKTKIKTINNIVPDNWIYVQEREVKMGRIQIFNNWSPYMVEDPKHKVWMGLEYFANEGDSLWAESDKEFIDMAIKELIFMGIIKRESDVLDATRIKVKKAYPAYFGSYSKFPLVQKELDSIPNLYCIGRNGQHRYNNMDHSMLTGLVAADKILAGDKDKASLWSVNAEKEYHEEKK